MSFFKKLLGLGKGPAADPSFPLDLRIAEIVRETKDASTIRFVRADGAPLGFEPGQFLTFKLTVNGKEVRRSYSFSSSPKDGAAITVKRIAGGLVSSYLVDEAKVGMTVRAAGPFGSFTLAGARPEEPWIFIAGGSGITPICSMLTSARRPDVELLYGNRGVDDIIFRDRIGTLARVRHFLELPTAGFEATEGRLTGDGVIAHLGDVSKQRFWVCGPSPMMTSVVDALRHAGVSDERIRTEHFTPTPIPSKTSVTGEGHAIEFARSKRVLHSAPGDSVLITGLAAGLALDSACEMGECGTCKVKLLSGHVEGEMTHGLSPDEREEGWILACSSRPTGPIVVDA